MPVVASVRLRYVPKDYWFDPAGIELQEGDHVIVETERGTEMGLCTATGLEVEEEDLKAPLKPVLRVATEEDLDKIDSYADTTAQAMRRFRELVEEYELDMKPVGVEFMYDGAHATFYFTADERIDFRTLVRDLASEFHIRVDMRQIGVRDEARALGGLGHCGQELCCARIGGDFQPVSIRMAKEQDLPLNPAKISGLCGRLMCCLRYEFEAYKDFKGRAPKKNALIETPLGLAKVVEFDTPREQVRVRFEDGKSMEIPVASMDTGDKVAREGENIRPCHVSQEAFDQILEDLHQDSKLAMMGDKLFSDDPDLADREAEAGSVERALPHRRRSTDATKSREQTSPTVRRKSARTREVAEPVIRTERRRRRSVAVGTGEVLPTQKPKQMLEHGLEEGKTEASTSRSRRRKRTPRPGIAPVDGSASKLQQGMKPRPGQHSSTVSGTAAKRQDASSDAQAPRKRRRRGKRGGRGRGSGGSAAGASE